MPESHYEGKLRGKGTLGRKVIMTVDNNLFRQAQFILIHLERLSESFEELGFLLQNHLKTSGIKVE